ncbi:MAG: S41 family peptidase [bacterium]
MKKMSISAAVLALILAFPCVICAADQTYQQLKILVDVLDLVKENYVDEVEIQKLVHGAANGIVRELDDFSQFMDSDTYKRIKSDTEGEFGGLGIRIGLRDRWITVITPIPGTPAYRAGIFPGDRIIKIEDESAKDMTPDDAVKKLRGTPGTKIRITVAREPESKDPAAQWTTHDFTITRETIRIEAVQHRMMDGKVGYLRLIDFTGHAAEDTFAALNDLKKQGMDALVLDMRYNPGGLLSAAVDISRYFLGSNKMIVFTKGRKKENYQEFRAASKAPFENLPLVALVNGGSASASEIVAGALQDNKRAVIIGSKTFGKASVQSVIPLSDASGLRLTVAKYHTPSGRSIQRHENEKENTGGIQPDMEIKVPREIEIKLMSQFEEIFVPGKAAQPAVKKEERVKDEILDRALEILKARDILSSLRQKEG